MVWEREFIIIIDYKIKPAGIRSFFRRLFLIRRALVTLTLQNYWGSTALCLPSCLLPVSILFPLLRASFLYKQMHPVREGDCLSVSRKPAAFMRDGLGESLKGWSVGGKLQWEETQHTRPLFLILRFCRLSREGEPDDDRGSRNSLGLLWRSGNHGTSPLINNPSQQAQHTREKEQHKEKLRSKLRWCPLNNLTPAFNLLRCFKKWEALAPSAGQSPWYPQGHQGLKLQPSRCTSPSPPGKKKKKNSHSWAAGDNVH